MDVDREKKRDEEVEGDDEEKKTEEKEKRSFTWKKKWEQTNIK